MAGVSSTSTVWLRCLSPRPFTDSRCLCLVAVMPFTSVTLIFLPGTAGLLCFSAMASSGEVFDLLAALGRDLRRAALLREPVERGAHDVVGIRGAVALGGDVRDTHHLEDRA